MNKVDSYREELAQLPPDTWPAWLAGRSNLPGPRANLERVRPAMERRLDSDDPVVRRALRQDLLTARLQRLDPVWAGRWLA